MAAQICEAQDCCILPRKGVGFGTNARSWSYLVLSNAHWPPLPPPWDVSHADHSLQSQPDLTSTRFPLVPVQHHSCEVLRLVHVCTSASLHRCKSALGQLCKGNCTSITRCWYCTLKCTCVAMLLENVSFSWRSLPSQLLPQDAASPHLHSCIPEIKLDSIGI